MAAKSSATTVWQGDLESGSGKAKAASGAIPRGRRQLGDADRSRRRQDQPRGAARHSPRLVLLHGARPRPRRSRQPARRADHDRDRHLRPRRGRQSSSSRSTGKVPGLEAAAFEEATKAAGEECPISQALAGNVEISVSATLEG